ncbi:pathogenesis-related thaumatin-like protein 3.5 [Euphorbia lathyris]|uniref:pathogenesis-related thaumatin-like protein 3.5 n=1 Tax=Euphorbia lathyris TaxID=212925 RepID=UPI003313F9DD
MALRHFLLLISIYLLGVEGRTITLKNKCATTIWPGYLEHYQNNENQHLKQLSDECASHNFKLRPGESINMTAPEDNWEGMIWGRHPCSFDSFGIGKCATGDCAGKLQCGGLDFPLPPFTLASITLNPSGEDSYLISLGGGFNLPMSILPYGHNNNNNNPSLCQASNCLSDINKSCPRERQVRFRGEIVACKSDCQALNKAEYCCVGAVDIYTNETCKASGYSSEVHRACPAAGTNGFDMHLSTFRCSGANYLVSFC